MTQTLTEKQRVVVEALEGARRAGVPLNDYAKAKGFELRPVYDAIAALRRRGALPGTDRPRKRKSRFVAVRVTSPPAPASEIARARSGLVCRLVCAQGWAIECGEWPAPKWVSALLSGRGDAASRSGHRARLPASRTGGHATADRRTGDPGAGRD